MLNAAENHSSFSAPVEENVTLLKRHQRLLYACQRMEGNLDNLISSLAVAENNVPDKENRGTSLSGLLRLLISHQIEEHSDFWQEIQAAQGKGGAA